MARLIAAILVLLLPLVTAANQNLVFSLDGDLKLALFLTDCNLNNQSPKFRSTANAAIWTINRLNTLNTTRPINLGLDIYAICEESSYYDAIFSIFQRDRSDHDFLGAVIADVDLVPQRVNNVAQVLEVPVRRSMPFWNVLFGAVAKVLGRLRILDDLTVLAPSENVLSEFYRLARKEWICVNNFQIYSINSSLVDEDYHEGTILLLGNKNEIEFYLQESPGNYMNVTLIIVPLDSQTIKGLPDGTIIIQPSFYEISESIEAHPELLPSPLLLEVAGTIISYVDNIVDSLEFIRCNTSHSQCLKKIKSGKSPVHLQQTPSSILQFLQITPVSNEFVYDIYRVEGLTMNKQVSINTSNTVEYFKSAPALSHYVKLFSFNIFDQSFKDDSSFDWTNSSSKPKIKCASDFDQCFLQCANFRSLSMSHTFFLPIVPNVLAIRPEAWVFAILSLALLGIVFCAAIFIFLTVKCFRQPSLEGNPILTLVLLASVTLLFISVLPFCVYSIHDRNSIYFSRFIFITLPYAFSFSLLAARSIMLSTISKDAGFMSHVSGYVQATLAVFIFAVQAAISMQTSYDYNYIFREHLLIYYLSYNITLLVILVIIAPLIMKSQRNYREGKYFTIAILAIACAWCFWIPNYLYLNPRWRDVVLCVGLIATASSMLGAIFIPRTYLMTTAAAKDRFASVLPSLATVSSAMDIYRASTQPIYDCVNIAAINAAHANSNASGTNPTTLYGPQSSLPPMTNGHDLYTSGPMPEDDDFQDVDLQIDNCNTPTSPNKVTRF